MQKRREKREKDWEKERISELGHRGIGHRSFKDWNLNKKHAKGVSIDNVWSYLIFTELLVPIWWTTESDDNTFVRCRN